MGTEPLRIDIINKKTIPHGMVFLLDGSQSEGPLTTAPGVAAGFATPPWRSGWPSGSISASAPWRWAMRTGRNKCARFPQGRCQRTP